MTRFCVEVVNVCKNIGLRSYFVIIYMGTYKHLFYGVTWWCVTYTLFFPNPLSFQNVCWYYLLFYRKMFCWGCYIKLHTDTVTVTMSPCCLILRYVTKIGHQITFMTIYRIISCTACTSCVAFFLLFIRLLYLKYVGKAHYVWIIVYPPVLKFMRHM